MILLLATFCCMNIQHWRHFPLFFNLNNTALDTFVGINETQTPINVHTVLGTFLTSQPILILNLRHLMSLNQKKIQTCGAPITEWIPLCHPFCCPGFESPSPIYASTILVKFVLHFSLEKNENKQREAGFGWFKIIKCLKFSVKILCQ